MKVRRLTYYRRAEAFRRKVYGLVSLLENWIAELESPDCQWTTDKLMYMHFDKDHEELAACLSDGDVMTHMTLMYYRQEVLDIVAAAEEMVEAFPRLHNVREAILVNHLNADGTDVARVRLNMPNRPSATSQQRAEYYGLTPDQLAAIEAQLHPRGYLLLSSGEKDTLRAAFIDALE
jgi:hypothetical protein